MVAKPNFEMGEPDRMTYIEGYMYGMEERLGKMITELAAQVAQVAAQVAQVAAQVAQVAAQLDPINIATGHLIEDVQRIDARIDLTMDGMTAIMSAIERIDTRIDRIELRIDTNNKATTAGASALDTKIDRLGTAIMSKLNSL